MTRGNLLHCTMSLLAKLITFVISGQSTLNVIIARHATITFDSHTGHVDS
jgi:hypothetical protein